MGIPEYYLGGDVKIVYEGNSISELWMSAKTYVKRICGKIKDLMDWDLKGYMNPMDPHYHAEVDGSDFLEGDEISKYRMMVGSLNWLVTLGRYDIHYTVCTLILNKAHDDPKERPHDGHAQGLWVSQAEPQLFD